MNANVPSGAAVLLDFIGTVETGKSGPDGYGVIYGHKQGKLSKPLTHMTVDEVQAAQGGWSKNHGSSAAGRYQFMRATLKGLIAEHSIPGSSKFTADLQDKLGYELLKRRGYIAFSSGSLPPRKFGNNLAMEWASLPVLQDIKGAHRQVTRGETYYAGDGVNKVLTKPETVEDVLTRAANSLVPKPKPTGPVILPTAPNPPPPDIPSPDPRQPEKQGGLGWLWIVGAAIAAVLAFVAFVPLPI
jgi:muramidase (phage lysozyme)